MAKSILPKNDQVGFTLKWPSLFYPHLQHHCLLPKGLFCDQQMIYCANFMWPKVCWQKRVCECIKTIRKETPQSIQFPGADPGFC